jgi:hypothetical protein
MPAGFNFSPTYTADGTIAPCVFVKSVPGKDRRVVQCVQGDAPIGISQEGMKRPPGVLGSDTSVAAEAGDTLEVWGLGNEPQLVLGAGGCNAGDKLGPDGSGNGIVVGAGVAYGARAQMPGTAGQKISVIVEYGLD